MSEEATLRASGARPLLERAVTHETVGAAVADLQLVLATTARPREEKIPVYAPREAIAAARQRTAERLHDARMESLLSQRQRYLNSVHAPPQPEAWASLVHPRQKMRCKRPKQRPAEERPSPGGEAREWRRRLAFQPRVMNEWRRAVRAVATEEVEQRSVWQQLAHEHHLLLRLEDIV